MKDKNESHPLKSIDQEIKSLEYELRMRNELPHLFLHPLYKWQREFVESNHRQMWICAANQIGKSTTQIIKAITLATDKDRWPKFFGRRTPRTFWYFYPTLKTATTEFKEKWEKVYLPQGSMRDDPDFGWKEDIRHKEIHAINFKSGVTIYFMSYKMAASDIQAVTLDCCFCDEEVPEDLYSEINARMISSQGYFSSVFTATIGQEWMRRIIEGDGEHRLFPNSWRRQISMYDCQIYEDNTPTKFTDEFINGVIATCKNEIEVQRRVFGKFVVEGGLTYPQFDRERHVKRPHKLPANWNIYAGIDYGSGGESGHPAAICFIAINPDGTKGRVFRTWRGDNVETAAIDIINKYIELSKDLNVCSIVYDWATRDLFTIGTRMNVPLTKADKKKEEGESLVNSLFRTDMIAIYDDIESRKLVNELVSLKVTTPKTRAKDDAIDAMKYTLVSMPWSFEYLNAKKTPISKPIVLGAREALIRKQNGEVGEQNLDSQIDIIASECSEYDYIDDEEDYF